MNGRCRGVMIAVGAERRVGGLSGESGVRGSVVVGRATVKAQKMEAPWTGWSGGWSMKLLKVIRGWDRKGRACCLSGETGCSGVSHRRHDCFRGGG